MSLYSPSVETAALARRLVLLFGILAPFLWSFAFCIPQMLRAFGDAKFTMYISVCSLLALRVFGSWLFGIYFDLGALGVWMGMFADWVGRAVGFGLRAFTNAWCKEKIPAD
jgi:Na+-driven multidrug efflux pump